TPIRPGVLRGPGGADPPAPRAVPHRLRRTNAPRTLRPTAAGQPQHGTGSRHRDRVSHHLDPPAQAATCRRTNLVVQRLVCSSGRVEPTAPSNLTVRVSCSGGPQGLPTEVAPGPGQHRAA